ncbi:MAG: hypothetical protein QM723_20450 [Myxococcaceae bacterium]
MSARLLALCLAFAWAGCQCVKPTEQVYACRPGGLCDFGFDCIDGFCLAHNGALGGGSALGGGVSTGGGAATGGGASTGGGGTGGGAATGGGVATGGGSATGGGAATGGGGGATGGGVATGGGAATGGGSATGGGGGTIDAGPNGDTCATAIPINLSLGAAIVYGSTVGKTDDYKPSCAFGGNGGADVFYTFTAEGTVNITVDGLDGGLTPVVELDRDACGGNPVQCDLLPPYTLNTNDSSPHVYTVVIDNQGLGGGGFRLSVMGAEVPPGDFCPTAIMLTLGPDGGVTVTGDNSVMSKNSQVDTCGGNGGSNVNYDVVYGVQVPSNGTLRYAISTSWQSGAITSGYAELAKGPSCADAGQVNCQGFKGDAGYSTSVTAGTYWLSLATHGSTTPGAYTVWVGFQ